MDLSEVTLEELQEELARRESDNIKKKEILDSFDKKFKKLHVNKEGEINPTILTLKNMLFLQVEDILNGEGDDNEDTAAFWELALTEIFGKTSINMLSD